MPLIRPDAVATLSRWREVAFSGGITLLGLWLMALGGVILLPFGAAVLGLGAVLALTALRRLRFAQTIAAPGVVEVIEGEVRYFGPSVGGMVSLAELVEIRLIRLRGHRMWRLKQADGQALLIPVDAAGAEALFDGFATLPGLDMAAAVAALAPQVASATALVPANTPDMLVIWHRKGRGLVA